MTHAIAASPRKSHHRTRKPRSRTSRMIWAAVLYPLAALVIVSPLLMVGVSLALLIQMRP